jgi:hypothetical protein
MLREKRPQERRKRSKDTMKKATNAKTITPEQIKDLKNKFKNLKEHL